MSMSSSSSSSVSSSSSSLRPIAPIYNASCNPPRRAKRPRSHSIDDDITPQPDPDDPPPKRRGRKPGTLSRAAREAQRKINHSLIEKARRTKINDALATLRELVPLEYKRPLDEDNDDDDDDDDLDPKRRSKTRPAGEKEFKLEILVRTVAYLQDLTHKVHQLEHSGCPRCSEPISLASPSKKRDVLPSISAWLPEGVATQLPTPPASATCPPTTNGPIPPVLTLPSPSTFLPPSTSRIQPRFSGFTPRPNTNPLSSPVYTPDDETAASLLLRISTTSPSRADYALTPSRLLGLSAER